MKIAAYVAGDKKIINPAVVALKSLKKYHSEIELYMIIDKKELTDIQIEFLKKNDIRIPKFDIEYEFSSSQNWPKEVFWNYKAPIIFEELGFDYSLKVDLDTLCLNKIEWEKIAPKNEIFTAVPTGYTLDVYLQKEKEFLIKEFKIEDKEKNYEYPNVGVIFFNNKRYIQSNLWEIMYDYYYRIVTKSKSKTLDIIFADQALFALILSTNQSIIWKKVSINYNYTLHDKKLVNNYNKFFKEVKICHFTGPKPWKKISLFYFFYNPYLYYYREVYYNYLKEIDIYDRDLNIKNYEEKSSDKFKSKIINGKLFKYWTKIWFIINKKRKKI